MTNTDRIKARIERDKARKAAKRSARAHGTWRAEDCFTLEELSAALTAFLRGHRSRNRAALQRISEMNRIIPAGERLSRTQPHGEFGWVFTIQNLMRSLQKRRRGVEWKGNVQRFLSHAVLRLKRMKDALLKGKLKVDETIRRIVLHERGKRRVIHAVMIDSRVVQGAFCDTCLIPLTEYGLIHDNPASTKGKGVSFARRRIELYLKRMARHHGNSFYMMSSDFKKFFDSIRHLDCLQVVRGITADRMLQGLCMKITRMYQEGELSEIRDPVQRERMAQELRHHRGMGLTLGSQVSQIMALVVPNGIDHAVKEGQGLRHYIRYMDDTISLADSTEELKNAGKAIRTEAAKIGLRLNPKKTIITKASRGVRYLQIRYRVTDTGHLVKTLSRPGIVRMRRKLVKFRRLVDRGEMSLDNVFDSFSSWWGNSFKVSAYRTRKAMLSLYNRLFHRYRMEGVYP